MKKITSLILLVVLVSSVFAVNKTGTTAAKFLAINAGSRAVGLGGAFTAIASDASAMYWNPSGIARLTKTEVLVNYTKWIADINYNYLAFSQPLSSTSAYGINFTSVTMGEMKLTRYGDEDTGETFKAGQFALGITYAMNLTDRFSIGSNIKYISEYIANNKATGIAVDIGTLFDTPYGFRLGTSISNFGPKMKMTGKDLLIRVDIAPGMEGDNESINGIIDTDDFDLPLLLRVGISGDVNIMDGAMVTWSVDANHPNDNSEFVNAGVELNFFDSMLMLRAGSKSMFMVDREEEFALGGGLNYPLANGSRFYFDYAYELMTNLGGIHKFTLRLTF